MEKIFNISEKRLIEIIEKAYNEGYEDSQSQFYYLEFAEPTRAIKGKTTVIADILLDLDDTKETPKKPTTRTRYHILPASPSNKDIVKNDIYQKLLSKKSVLMQK